MGSEMRPSDLAVIDALFFEGDPPGVRRFDFFQAVRLLLNDYARRHPDTPPDSPDAVVRFRSHLSLAFPPSDIHKLERQDGEELPAMTVSLLGLTGPSGVLPRHYTQWLMEQCSNPGVDEPAAKSFFDIFNHRLICLLYQAWEKYRIWIPYERGDDRNASRYLLSFVGLNTPGLHNRLNEDGKGVQDDRLASYAGLLAQRPHSACALESILRDYFQVDVGIQQFIGRWLPLNAANLTRLGQTNHTLGKTLVLGSMAWDRQTKFRIVIGPLNKQQFVSFLPDGPAHAAVVKFVRFFVGMSLEFDIQLVLRGKEVAGHRLGTRAESGSCRLGESLWLIGGNQSLIRNVSDAIFQTKDLPR